MKKFLQFAIVISAAIVFTSCEKAAIELNNDIPEKGTEGTTGILQSAELISSIPATKAYMDALTLAKENGVLDSDKTPVNTDEINVLSTILDLVGIDVDEEVLAKYGPKVKIWRINYWTEGGYCKEKPAGKYEKEKILLSADVCYLESSGADKTRELESISIFNGTFNSAEGDLAVLRDLVLPVRALYNAVVIFPWYQGSQIDRGVHAVTPGEFLIKGQQAIDAELAAIEFINSISDSENIYLSDDYYTEIMGISNGGGTALASQYLLENDSAYKKINSESIHLVGTYLGEGCTSYSQVFPILMEDNPCPDQIASSLTNIEEVKPGAYISSVLGAWYTYKLKPVDKKPEDKNYQKELAKYQEEEKKMQENFFKSDLLTKKFHNENTPYTEDADAENIIYAARYGNLYKGALGDFVGMTIEDIVNESLLDESGNIDMENQNIFR